MCAIYVGDARDAVEFGRRHESARRRHEAGKDEELHFFSPRESYKAIKTRIFF